MGTTTIGAAAGTAGTQVRFVEPARAAVASPLGTTLLVGGFAWGPIDEVVIHTGRGDYADIRDKVLREDPTPLNSEQFYEAARGAGTLLTLRLVDGDENQSLLHIFDRDVSAGRRMLTVADSALPTRVVVAQGLHPGRHGGQIALLGGFNADLAAIFSATAGTFTTGVTMLQDRFRDATLTIVGHSRTYAVTANSVAGVLSIEVPTGDAGPTGAGHWAITLDRTRFDGDPEGLALQVGTSQRNAGTDTALDIWNLHARSTVKHYDALGTDTSEDTYWDQVIDGDAQRDLQRLIDVTTDVVADPSADDLRPANWVGVVDLGSAVLNTLTLVTHYWARNASVSVTGDAFLDSSSIAYGTDPRRVQVVMTFTAATTADVVISTWEGTVLSDGLTVANTAGLTLGTPFVSGSVAQWPTFTLEAGANPMSALDTITVHFNPLPANMTDHPALLAPHAHDQGDPVTNDIRTALAIVSNTSNTISLAANVDLGVDHNVSAPTAPFVAGINAGTYDMSGGPGLTWIYNVSGETPDTTLVTTLNGAAETAAALAADLTTLEIAANDPPRLVYTDVAGTLSIAAAEDFGATATVVVQAGTLNAQIGAADSTTHTNGTDGTIVALSFAQDMWDGRDGVATLGSAAEYTTAFNVSSSPINDIRNEALGLIKIAIPGEDTAASQNAAQTYSDTFGYMYRGEIDPSNATNEATAASWVRDNLDGTRNRSIAWDSYGFPRRRPFRGQETSIPMSGAILGMEARTAAEEAGYHIAAAGKGATIGDIFERTASFVGPGNPAPKLDAQLFPIGLQAINQQGSNVYVWGDRNSEDLYVGTVWKHKYESVLHIMHSLRVAGEPFVFEPLNTETRLRLVGAIRPLMRGFFDAGWFIRNDGDSFEDVVVINVGPDVNPPAVQAIGELRAEVSISGIIGTAERVIFTLGSAGVGVQEQTA